MWLCGGDNPALSVFVLVLATCLTGYEQGPVSVSAPVWLTRLVAGLLA
jgi:hypothetical protein